jgi:hypothetical protein
MLGYTEHTLAGRLMRSTTPAPSRINVTADVEETLSETYANQSERLARLLGFALIAPGAKAMFGRDLIEARADDGREAAERQEMRLGRKLKLALHQPDAVQNQLALSRIDKHLQESFDGEGCADGSQDRDPLRPHDATHLWSIGF